MTNPFTRVATTVNQVRNEIFNVPSFFNRVIKFNLPGKSINDSTNESIYHTEINLKTQTLIKTKATQWRLYKRNYFQCRKNMLLAANNRIQNSELYQAISLSDLGQVMHIDDIKTRLLVPAETYLAEIACIDEGTQAADFINETNLRGKKLGTISDPVANRYILDIAGSGALKYICKATDGKNISIDDLLNIEKIRLEDMASRFANWCQKREIIKLTVTYHASCGAVALRMRSLPELSQGKTDLEIAKECALNLAKKIQTKAIENDYELEVTLAFIGDKQMCKLRPMQMHNALGTIGYLDSRVLGQNFDALHHVNFFNVLIASDFEEGGINSDYKIDVIHSAVKNLCLSVNIAFSENGWGSKQFDYNRPYILVLCANGKEQELQASQIIDGVMNSIETSWKEKLEYYLIRTDL